jgi:carbamoyltransferase
VGLRRYKENGKGYYFTPELVEWLGPKRHGDEIDDPYIHYAASVQALLEDVALKMIDYYLGDIIRETGRIAMAGGVALNVKLNQRIIALPDVKELFVQPASGDNGTSLGAASYAANRAGEQVQAMEHAYLGPAYTTEQCIAACEAHPAKPKFTRLKNAAQKGAELLADGNPLAWLQGRMEFGPRALGCRSILGDPSHPGVADRINAQIKYRERWRPFCPSMLDRVAEDIIQTSHPAPYMTFTFDVAEHWKSRIPEVVHEDGTARAQIVNKATNPRYYALIEHLEKLRGVPVVLNTSLNRRGEPMVCSPTDALNMFFGCDLEYLIMEDILVTKS